MKECGDSGDEHVKRTVLSYNAAEILFRGFSLRKDTRLHKGPAMPPIRHLHVEQRFQERTRSKHGINGGRAIKKERERWIKLVKNDARNHDHVDWLRKNEYVKLKYREI
ncbi:hypothetical protein ACFXTI_025579 [Malus domestica]